MTRAGQFSFPGERRARKIEGQYVPHRLAMIESHAYRALSLTARRCLDRIEIEHMHHAGKENGQLPVTYQHFIEYGIGRRFIGPALRELVALGFVEITEHGVAGNAEHRAPNKFRLTYVHAGRMRASDEWRRIRTIEEAEQIARHARAQKPEKWRVKKQKPVHLQDPFRCAKGEPRRGKKLRNGDTASVHQRYTTSISRVGSHGVATGAAETNKDSLMDRAE
jgi:hypothetical protein